MQIRNIRRFVYRQLVLPPEYQQRLSRVKQIIQEFTFRRPSSEVTLMCLIDEFLNLHDEKGRSEQDQSTQNTDEVDVSNIEEVD